MTALTGITPVNPHAKAVRAQLRERGLEHLVERVTSGRKATRVRVRYGAEDGSAEQIAEALRPLWHDGKRRVSVIYSGLVLIDRAGWYHTMPNTPDGLAALTARENERNALLLAAAENGARLFTGDYTTVRYAPSDADPHRPWLDRYAGSYTPFEVSMLTEAGAGS